MATSIHSANNGFGDTVAANLTRYYQPVTSVLSAQTTEGPAQIRIRNAGVISKLWVRITGNSVTATSTLTSRKNTAAGNLTASIPSSTTGEFEDTSNSDTIAATDLINYRLVTGATGTQITVIGISQLFTPTTDTVTKFFDAFGAVSSASTTVFLALSGNMGAGSPETSGQYRARIPGTLKNLYTNVTSNARTTATTFRSRKNTANGNLVISVGSSATGIFEDTSNTDTIAAADLISKSVATGTGTGSLLYVGLGIEYISTSGMFLLLHSNNGTSQGASTQYEMLGGGSSGNSTESTRQTKSRLAFTAGNLQIRVNSGSSVTGTSTYRLRVNAADSALTLSIASGATGIFEDTSHTVAVAASDQIDTALTVVGTGTGLAWSLMAFTGTVVIAVESELIGRPAGFAGQRMMHQLLAQ